MQKLFALSICLLGAFLFAQLPELVQQYGQRLGGTVDELSLIVRNFDEDARRAGYDTSSALTEIKKNSNRLARDQGQRMQEYAARLDLLRSQQESLAKGVTVAAVFAVAFDFDAQIMSRAWAAYAPAFPTSFAGVIFALIGFALASLSALLTEYLSKHGATA